MNFEHYFMVGNSQAYVNNPIVGVPLQGISISTTVLPTEGHYKEAKTLLYKIEAVYFRLKHP